MALDACGTAEGARVSTRPSLAFEVVPAFDFTSPEYLDLHERADATAFQHPLWLDRAFARLIDAADRSPTILIGRSACDDRLMLVLPMIRRKVGPFSMLDAADFDVADYNALVFDRNAANDPRLSGSSCTNWASYGSFACGECSRHNRSSAWQSNSPTPHHQLHGA